jgi:hypothetical protein
VAHAVLTRLFTPLFTVVLLVFLGTMMWTVPFEMNFEHSTSSWSRIKTWLEEVRRFAQATA